MAEPADKGEARGGGVPRLGCRPMASSPWRGLERPQTRTQGRPRQLPGRACLLPGIPPPRPCHPFRLFNSIQLGLPARKLVSSDIQFN